MATRGSKASGSKSKKSKSAVKKKTAAKKKTTAKKKTAKKSTGSAKTQKSTPARSRTSSRQTKSKSPGSAKVGSAKPAAQAKLDFRVGKKAVYPAHGVGEITAIETREIAGKVRTFYTLRILENNMKIMIPTDNADNVGLREIISRKDANKVFSILKSSEVAVDTQPWNRRYREYMEMLKSGSPFEVAKVLRDLFRLKSDKDLSFGERRLLDTARSLLVKELALALKVKETKIEKEIQQIFEA